MYILLNKEGNVITSIPHGQIVRQLNAFDLYVCFPFENKYRNLSPFAEFSINGKFQIAGEIDTEAWGTAFTFQKLDRNEAIFEFKEGQKYYQYHIIVPSTVTAVYGPVPFVVSVVLDYVTRQARSVVNVAKTIGSDERSSISTDEKDEVMKALMLATNLYTFIGESCTQKAEVDDLYLYSWKSLGFVRGFVTMKDSELTSETEPMSNISALAPYADNYVLVACFHDCVDITVPAVMFGHSDAGEDVEFKIVGDGDTEDGVGDAYLLMNRMTDVDVDDRIAIVGTFMAKRIDGRAYPSVITDFSITANELENGSITTEKIADGAITSEKLSESLVGLNIADNSITAGKIVPSDGFSVKKDSVVYSDEDSASDAAKNYFMGEHTLPFYLASVVDQNHPRLYVNFDAVNLQSYQKLLCFRFNGLNSPADSVYAVYDEQEETWSYSQLNEAVHSLGTYDTAVGGAISLNAIQDAKSYWDNGGKAVECFAYAGGGVFYLKKGVDSNHISVSGSKEYNIGFNGASWMYDYGNKAYTKRLNQYGTSISEEVLIHFLDEARNFVSSDFNGNCYSTFTGRLFSGEPIVLIQIDKDKWVIDGAFHGYATYLDSNWSITNTDDKSHNLGQYGGEVDDLLNAAKTYWDNGGTLDECHGFYHQTSLAVIRKGLASRVLYVSGTEDFVATYSSITYEWTKTNLVISQINRKIEPSHLNHKYIDITTEIGSTLSGAQDVIQKAMKKGYRIFFDSSSSDGKFMQATSVDIEYGNAPKITIIFPSTIPVSGTISIIDDNKIVLDSAEDIELFNQTFQGLIHLAW